MEVFAEFVSAPTPVGARLARDEAPPDTEDFKE
jgi:hypothetical protein